MFHELLSGRMNLSLAQANRQIRDEFMRFFYENYTFHFSCCCDMVKRLKTNKLLRNTIRAIKLHWTGAESDKAFTLIKSGCKSLERLELVISRVCYVMYDTSHSKQVRKS